LIIGSVSLVQAQDRLGLSDAPAYAPEKPITGQLELVGSTLMQPLATLWMEDFTKIHPELVSKVDCQGSEESFKKLADSPNVVGLLSREVDPEELARWNKELNKKLVAIEVGYDILSMIVHKDNPIRALAWNSQTKSPMSLSNDKPIEKWSDLGVDGTLGEKPITHVLIVPSHGLRSVAEGIFNLKDRNSAVIVQKDNQLDIVISPQPTSDRSWVSTASKTQRDRLSNRRWKIHSRRRRTNEVYSKPSRPRNAYQGWSGSTRSIRYRLTTRKTRLATAQINESTRGYDDQTLLLPSDQKTPAGSMGMSTQWTRICLLCARRPQS